LTILWLLVGVVVELKQVAGVALVVLELALD
jgi:hypothetical protein